MAQKPQLSFWQIWNMSFGFLGIQFGFALQNANVSRIFETLGANIDDIPILWIAAPITGLIVQPIIGHMSDKTWGRFGRRRPYFLVGAILASIAIFFMPNSPVLWVAAGMLWIMDASINISMEPFRAFVGDMLPSSQRTGGFAMQTFFIGVGAVIASALPYIFTNWFNIPNTAEDGAIPLSVKYSFYLGALVFFLAVLWTVLRTKEYSPEQLRSFDEAKAAVNPEFKAIAESEEPFPVSQSKFMRIGIIWLVIGILLTVFLFNADTKKELYILSFGIGIFGLLQIFASRLVRSASKGGFLEVMNDLYTMPKTMRQLAVVQFFSWFALFAMWIYTTAAVTSHVYGTSDTTSDIYNQGADWVGVCFMVYNGIAALFAYFLYRFAKGTSRKMTHTVCLIAGGLGLISIYFIKDPNLLLLSMVGIGIAWASILAMPYAILTEALPSHKMGVYMGIFNFFIVIPQIVAASILGFLVSKFFGSDPVSALVIGGISMALAGIITLGVHDPGEASTDA